MCYKWSNFFYVLFFANLYCFFFCKKENYLFKKKKMLSIWYVTLEKFMLSEGNLAQNEITIFDEDGYLHSYQCFHAVIPGHFLLCHPETNLTLKLKFAVWGTYNFAYSLTRVTHIYIYAHNAHSRKWVFNVVVFCLLQTSLLLHSLPPVPKAWISILLNVHLMLWFRGMNQ